MCPKPLIFTRSLAEVTDDLKSVLTEKYNELNTYIDPAQRSQFRMQVHCVALHFSMSEVNG